MREGLNRGLRPRDLRLSVEGSLYGSDRKLERADVWDEIKMGKLSLKENK